jgi:hypothetical protein
MKIISHRGNISGRSPEKENVPDYIDVAINLGYDVEIDIRSINGELWLGHDDPQYKVDHNWLNERRHHIWIHCKNIAAAKECWAYHSFCHSEDPFTYTSVGKIWMHGNNKNYYELDDSTIIPLISKEDVQDFMQKKFKTPFAVCTDYPILFGVE